MYDEVLKKAVKIMYCSGAQQVLLILYLLSLKRMMQ